MPVTARISDAELRQRLEDHAYNVPPITDTTRSILIKKLNQLDAQRPINSKKQGSYSPLDYSSAEDEDFPIPLANSTRRGGRAPVIVSSASVGKNGASGSKKSKRQNEETSSGGQISTRVTRSSRNNSRAGTPQNGSNGRTSDQNRRDVSLMTHSETEEGSEEEEDEEDIEEEEDEEEDSEEEDEVNGVDRVDLAVQTSLVDSPSPPRFRGQRVPTTSPSSSYSPSPSFPIMSPYLRKNINKHGSLNEALSTLPSPKVKPVASTADSTTSPTTQAPRPALNPSSQHNYSRDNGSRSYMMVSSLIMAVAAAFFLVLVIQYLSLKPPQTQTGARVPVCGGIDGEIPHSTCVPSSELNQTVELYKSLVSLLPGSAGCVDKAESMLPREAVIELLASSNHMQKKELSDTLDNLLVLLRLNPGWGIALSEDQNEIHIGLVRPSSWMCVTYEWGMQFFAQVRELAWNIAAVLMIALFLLMIWRLYWWRVARTSAQQEEVFGLVRQATNFLYQHHQMITREGKGGPTYLAINHIRDQLIPPQDRASKSRVWADVVAYIQNNESRVREDVQKIFGEDFQVWQWLPDMPWSPESSPSSSPHTPSSTASSNNTSNSNSNSWPHVSTTQGVVGWQGCAFPLGKHVAAPLAPPTSCLKVRHMFDVLQQRPGWVNQVKDEILRRCSESSILHIAVDTQSEEGTVYIKTASMEDAGKVFKCLHGQWYRGQLVTAKYLRLERYHERFPDAKTSCAPLKCTK